MQFENLAIGNANPGGRIIYVHHRNERLVLRGYDDSIRKLFKVFAGGGIYYAMVDREKVNWRDYHTYENLHTSAAGMIMLLRSEIINNLRVEVKRDDIIDNTFITLTVDSYIVEKTEEGFYDRNALYRTYYIVAVGSSVSEPGLEYPINFFRDEKLWKPIPSHIKDTISRPGIKGDGMLTKAAK